MTIRVLLVDDEPLARAGLATLLGGEPDVVIVGQSASGADAILAIERAAPDVVFLDIGLPDFDGFQVLDRIDPAKRPAVIFVTAVSDRALQAFEVRALDYVTKPLRRDRVREAVARVRERIVATRQPVPPGPVALKVDGRIHLVEPGTIDWIDADDDHVVVHAGGQTWRAREALREIEARLDPTRFVRIHRSTIVRLNRIRELQPWFRGDYVVVLHGGTKLRLSRTYRPHLAQLLGGL